MILIILGILVAFLICKKKIGEVLKKKIRIEALMIVLKDDGRTEYAYFIKQY